jgi:hypothetical protein
MRKKCISCSASFTLSGSGKRQKYCSKCARRGDGQVRGLSGSNLLKTKGAGDGFSAPMPPPEMGQFIRQSIEAQKGQPNPISFTSPDGHKGRVWLAKKIIGDDRHWRVHVSEAIKLVREGNCGFAQPRKATADIIRIEGSSHIPLTRLKPNPPARDPACVEPDIWPRPWGYKVRLYIEAEEELQALGCGWRTFELSKGFRFPAMRALERKADSIQRESNEVYDPCRT